MSQYNKDSAIYKIVGRYMDGVSIVGYHLIDANGNSDKVSKKDVEKLAGAGLIANCTIVEYEGSNYIRGIGIKISEIPVMNIRNTNNLNTKSNLMIKCKILSGDRLIGYGVVDIHGKEYKLSKEKIWQLAREKSIVNAAAQVVNNQKRLVGLGIELSKLPIVYAG